MAIAVNSTPHEQPLEARGGSATTVPEPASPRATTRTLVFGIVAIIFAIIGGAFGILKGMALISIGVALSLVGLVLAAWALVLAVRRASKGGMVVGAIAATGSFFALTAGALTLISRIITKDI